MCLVPDIPAPKLPKEVAEMKEPDGGAIRSAVSRRVTDRMRAASDTVLTSGSGVSANAPTASKTLLGQ